jgi:hypothetical protein
LSKNVEYDIPKPDGSTLIAEINARFALRIKKLPVNEAVEQRINIIIVCQMPTVK